MERKTLIEKKKITAKRTKKRKKEMEERQRQIGRQADRQISKWIDRLIHISTEKINKNKYLDRKGDANPNGKIIFVVTVDNDA